jgi:predicted MPP superfamily phosphohydrolase
MTIGRRAHDRGPHRRPTISRRALLKACVATGASAVAGAAAYGYFGERHSVRVVETAVPVTRLPPPLSGLRIGLLTDIHRSRWVLAEHVHQAVQLLMRTHPDLIVLGGDYVTWGDRAYVERSAEALVGLSAPYGVFAILGNHDDDHDMPAALTARGIHVLRDARTDLGIRGETLALAGLRFWTRRPADIAALVKGVAGTAVLLAHDPRRFAEAAALKIPLVLSGHTHGGQVVLPGVGALAGRKFPVVAGSARQQDTTLFVSRGVGTVYVPIRINCPPEVNVLKLVPSGGPAHRPSDPPLSRT